MRGRATPTATALAATPRVVATRPAEPAAQARVNSTWQRWATQVPVSSPGDACEREADRAAEQAVGQGGSVAMIHAAAMGVQRKCSACAERERDAPLARLGALRGRGTPLPSSTRTHFEQRFGHDFGDVRVHGDAQANALARTFDASAFTYGRDIVVADDRFVPSSNSRLLAHELAHVVQQARGEPMVQRQTPPPAPRVTPRQEPTVEAWANDDMATLLTKLRGLRAKGTLRPEVWGSGPILIGENRIKAAALAVENEALPASARKPEDMSELRDRLIAGTVADRVEIETQFPDAKIPTAPTLPAGGLPAAPAKSKHAGWPSSLLATVHLSLADRMAGMPASSNNLANAFWVRRPTDVWDALDAMGSAAAVIESVYTMWSASGLSWSHVRSIRNIWSGTSMGFNFNSPTIGALRKELEASSSYCKDKNGGDLYHAWVEGTSPCWRQTVKANTPGLHFCLGGSVATVHIDPHQVVEMRESDGTCNYDMDAVRQHFKDLGWWPSFL